MFLYNLYTEIGVVSGHILYITNNRYKYCWNVSYWKSYTFHYLRDNTSDELNKIFENIAFLNPYLGVLETFIESSEFYPVFCKHKIGQFEEIYYSKWLVIKNWPQFYIN